MIGRELAAAITGLSYITKLSPYIDRIYVYYKASDGAGQERIEISADKVSNLCKKWAWHHRQTTLVSGIAEFGGFCTNTSTSDVFVDIDNPLKEHRAVILAAQNILDGDN